MARRILLADDSVTAQNMGRRILTDAGYEVVTVNNGSAALKKIQEQKPDLIVLDVYMPGYGGLEVCQRVKETTRIPVLLTVGKLEPFKPDEARRVRADAFIVKPFEASELLSALTKLEDKIVPQPQPQKPGRFAKTLAALEQADKSDNGEKFGDRETGWKNRLIIPSGGPKAEGSEAQEGPEPAMHTAPSRPEVAEPKPVEEARASEPVKEKEFERPIPAGIPADITADEIAAISAAAANVSTPTDPPGASSHEASAPAAETVEAAQAVSENKVPELQPSAEGTVAEQAVASVLAQAASEVAQAKADEAAQPEKDADVMAAIASLAPPIEADSAPQAPAAQPVSEPAATAGLTGPRWIASSVEVSAEETSLDLHAEMTATTQTAAGTAAEVTAPAHAVATVAVAEAVAVESASASEPATVSETFSAPVMEAPAREEAFAAAVGAGTQDVPGMSAAAPATAAAPAEPASEVPPKAAELAAAWQHWKQIRDSIVGSNLTEQIAEVAAAEVAAAEIKADSEAAQAGATEISEEEASEESSEPSAIASIVDSVLAELKPKLVEEIARKMNAEKKSSRKK